MRDFATALALVLVIEGILYALVPGLMKRVIQEAVTMPPNVLRIMGLAGAVIGVGLVWAVRRTWPG